MVDPGRVRRAPRVRRGPGVHPRGVRSAGAVELPRQARGRHGPRRDLHRGAHLLMGRVLDGISDELAAFLEAQPVFFVATAPDDPDGLVNCSPKGLDTFRVLDAQTVAYLDLTGSGVETIAHLRDNGRITLMFCAFTGRPDIVRLQGRGHVVPADAPGAADHLARFPEHPGARAV